jgi:hypothetical protein
MSKLASATTIPVMNNAMQENSRISFRIARTAMTVERSTRLCSQETLAVIAARHVQPSDDESKQFNGSEPDDQECKGYRVVFEPNTHGSLSCCRN